MKRATLLFAICVFSCVLVESASATPCSSTQYDMMTWFTMGSSWSIEYTLTGNANPLYTYRGNAFYWVKGAAGYPWDVNYYDNNFIYQWATEYQWNDPTSTKLSAVRWIYYVLQNGQYVQQNQTVYNHKVSGLARPSPTTHAGSSRSCKLSKVRRCPRFASVPWTLTWAHHPSRCLTITRGCPTFRGFRNVGFHGSVALG